MKAEELRAMLAGTGAEVIEIPYPICLVSKHEFRMATDQEVEDEYDCSNFDDPKPSPIVSIMPRTSYFTNRSLAEVMNQFGGKKLFVYNCEDIIEDVVVWKVRTHEWEKQS